jgi:hypothetical protein
MHKQEYAILPSPVRSVYFTRSSGEFIIRHTVGELNQAKFIEAFTRVPGLFIDSKDDGPKHE